VIPRTDGIGAQAVSGGFGDDTPAPDRAKAEEAAATLAELYARFGR
jgi:hypothetical protein